MARRLVRNPYGVAIVCAVALFVSPVVAQPGGSTVSGGNGAGKAKRTCDQTASRKGWLPHSALRFHWTVKATIKGGMQALSAVSERNNACVGGGISRGILFLAGGSVDGLTPGEVHQQVMGELASNATTSWSPGALVSGSWQGGGSGGVVGDFKHVKDMVTSRLYAQGKVPKIVTNIITPGTMPPKDVLDDIRKALQAGHAVEVDLDYGAGKGHFATVVEVVEAANGDLGITIADDPVQGDGKAALEIRNTYFFPRLGDCYYWSRAHGGRFTKAKRRIRGVMLEQKVGPKKSKRS